VGGDGGRGVVAVVFARGSAVASLDSLPAAGVTSHLVIAAPDDAIEAWLAAHASAIYYGGIAKATYRYAPAAGRFEPVPRFCVSSLAAPGHAVGATAFTGEATEALRTLLDRAPPGSRVEAVGLFPCFMRDKNAYGRNQVEPDAVTALLPGTPIYGMFCHGELGPRTGLGFNVTQKPQHACTQHSMTTVVAMHARSD
jgi:hypothetical protein